jgi:hypothetical protein
VRIGVVVASTTILLALGFHRAWVGEDAFITFRTIDQFVHGAGLRWNLEGTKAIVRFTMGAARP